ncbi:hypothetical protein [Mycobacterium sp. C31M]
MYSHITQSEPERGQTADELDAAILELLRQSPGQSAWWPDIRDRLPPATFWAKAQSLTRLVDTGQVHTVKVGGRDLITLGIVVPVRRPRSSRWGAACVRR